MKNKKVVFFGFLILSVFIPKRVSAANTFECGWEGGWNPTSCVVTSNTCSTTQGYVIDESVCENMNSIQCVRGNELPCIYDPEKAETTPDAYLGGGIAAGKGVLCSGDSSAINTAIGCISVLNKDGGKSFASDILRWAIGVGGGIAFLLILYSGFMLMTSTGNPERIKAGQELMTSAISGIVLLIFSVFILNFIGVNILGIFG